MIAQTYKCTSSHPDAQHHPEGHHIVELTGEEFRTCNGLGQHQQCKAWYGEDAKLTPIIGTQRELPTCGIQIGQVWRLYQNPNSYLFIAAVSKDQKSIFVNNNSSGESYNSIMTVESLRRWYILDTNF